MIGDIVDPYLTIVVKGAYVVVVGDMFTEPKITLSIAAILPEFVVSVPSIDNVFGPAIVVIFVYKHFVHILSYT